VFGLEKGEVHDFKNVTDEELLPYCMNDANIVKTVFIQYIDFLKQHDLGNFAVTAAGQSFNAYRHRFMREKSILIHGDDKIYPLEQASYRGGRTDIFKQGEYHDIIKLDINSMYPYVMATHKYPTRPLSKEPITGLTVDDLKKSLAEGKFVVADLDIIIHEPFLAVKRTKLLFPVGGISNAYMTSPEIEYLLSSPDVGEVVKVNSAMVYEQEQIFSSYVDYFYKLKSESKTPVMRELSKLFLNSLYGKFGQRQNGDISLDTSPENDIISQENNIGSWFILEGEEKHKIMRIGDKFYRVEPQLPTPGKQSSPIISSAVTSYARIYLWHLMKCCGVENVYYCDTDSIFTNRRGYERLEALGYIDNKRLGKLKVEGIGNCILRGPKDYDWIDADTGQLKRTIKGVPRNSVQQEDGGYSYRQWETGVNRYRHNSTEEVQIKNSVKYLSRQYDKGFVDDSGQVHPFTFNEIGGEKFAFKPSRVVIPKETARPSISKHELKRRINYVHEVTGLDMFSSRAMLSLVNSLGYEHDTFPWDELDSSLSYNEQVQQVHDLAGTHLSSVQESRLIKLYNELKLKAQLDPIKYRDELEGVERELMNINLSYD